MKSYIQILVGIIFATTVQANQNDLCHSVPSLKSGFDLETYQHCDASIKECPLDGLFFDKNCIQQKLKEHHCRQLSALSSLLKVNADMITAKKVQRYSLITVNYPGDGGEQFYVISPKGCVVNTNVNPEDYDREFKKQFEEIELLNEVTDEPEYSALPDSGSRFTVKIASHRQCRACEVVARSTIAFDFTKEGVLNKTLVLGFKKN